ncbi:MAG: glycine zipper 2TM domain-containing protein [Saezia sp.]
MRSTVITAMICVCITFVLTLSGCASSLSGDTYSREEARQVQTVRTGTIIGIRVVNVEGTDTGVGKVGGAVVGGIIGSRIDHGHGAWAVLGGVVGALGGGIAGSKAEEAMTRKAMLELTIKEDGGRTIVIVQEEGNDDFDVGNKVNIISSSRGVTRVSPQ